MVELTVNFLCFACEWPTRAGADDGTDDRTNDGSVTSHCSDGVST